MEMKKKKLLVLTLLFCIGTAGCGKAADNNGTMSETLSSSDQTDIGIEVGTKQLDTPELATESAASGDLLEETDAKGSSSVTEGDIRIDFKGYSKVYTDKEGNQLMALEGNQPSVTISENQKAGDKMTSYFNVQLDEHLRTAEEYEGYAQEAFTEGSAGLPYFLNSFHNAERVDTAVISIVNSYSEYTGGAHPNSTTTAVNFDSSTGNELTFSDIVTDESSARQLIEKHISEQIEKIIAKEGEIFFGEYKTEIPKLLTDESWYLDKEGIVVIANPYSIAPYSTGLLGFKIPYGEFSYLKDAYRPTAAS